MTWPLAIAAIGTVGLPLLGLIIRRVPQRYSSRARTSDEVSAREFGALKASFETFQRVATAELGEIKTELRLLRQCRHI